MAPAPDEERPGRRAAFTPRAAFRPDSGYTVRLSPGIRDRGGQGLGQPVALRFRTRPLELVIRSRDGSLVRWRLGGEPQRLAEPRVGEFAVGPEGGVAYERPEERMLVVLSAEGAPLRRITLPSDLDIRQLEWGGAGSALSFLGTGAIDRLRVATDIAPATLQQGDDIAKTPLATADSAYSLPSLLPRRCCSFSSISRMRS